MVKDTPSIPLAKLNGSKTLLIMNEYACYGKGHTIHSSGQIEWFKTQLMTDLSKLVVNSRAAPLMAMLCPWFAEVASCTCLFLENPLIKI